MKIKHLMMPFIIGCLLIGCSPKQNLSSSFNSSGLSIYFCDEIPVRNEITVLNNKAIERINTEYVSSFNRLKSINSNAVFSPVSFAVTDSLKRDDLDVVQEITENITVSKNSFSCNSINAAVRPWANAFNNEDIQKYKNSRVSVFSGSEDELKEPLKNLFGTDIKFGPGTTYINQINLNDGFYRPWEMEKRSFSAQNEVDYAFKKGDFLCFEDDDAIAVQVVLSLSTLTLIMPKDDKTLGELDFSSILAKPLVYMTANVHVPEFQLSYQFSENDPDPLFEGRYTLQETTFAFDHYGIKASSTTQSVPTSSNNQVLRDIVFDKPFLFVSAVEDLPIYVGTVYQISK